MNEDVVLPPELPAVAGTGFEVPPVDVTLPNGLEVWVAPRRSVPLAAVRLVVSAGRATIRPADPDSPTSSAPR